MKQTLIRYPWPRWLNRRRLTLVQGVDYLCQPHSMAQQFRNAAARAGIRLSIRITGGTLLVVNQGRSACR